MEVDSDPMETNKPYTTPLINTLDSKMGSNSANCSKLQGIAVKRGQITLDISSYVPMLAKQKRSKQFKKTNLNGLILDEER
jgi:hypothetical protein